MREKPEEINSEFTSPCTPHKNGVVEQGFDIIHSHMCAMMAHTGVYENLNTDLWTECAATTNKIENIMVNPHEEKCAHEKF